MAAARLLAFNLTRSKLTPYSYLLTRPLGFITRGLVELCNGSVFYRCDRDYEVGNWTARYGEGYYLLGGVYAMLSLASGSVAVELQPNYDRNVAEYVIFARVQRHYLRNGTVNLFLHSGLASSHYDSFTAKDTHTGPPVMGLRLRAHKPSKCGKLAGQ